MLVNFLNPLDDELNLFLGHLNTKQAKRSVQQIKLSTKAYLIIVHYIHSYTIIITKSPSYNYFNCIIGISIRQRQNNCFQFNFKLR